MQICWFESEYACVDSRSIINRNLCVVLEYSTKQFFDADNKSHLFVQNGGKILSLNVFQKRMGHGLGGSKNIISKIQRTESNNFSWKLPRTRI